MKFSHPYFLRDLLTHSHNCSSSRRKGKMRSSASCSLPQGTTHRFQPVLRIRAAKCGSSTEEGMHHQGCGALEVQPYIYAVPGRWHSIKPQSGTQLALYRPPPAIREAVLLNTSLFHLHHRAGKE